MPTLMEPKTKTPIVIEPLYQVVLWNDNVHTMPEVIKAIMKTFGHTRSLSKKIVSEANDNGKAIAEVEGQEQAVLHRDQLRGYSPPFVVNIEKV